jgi:hypothetical protein
MRKAINENRTAQLALLGLLALAGGLLLLKTTKGSGSQASTATTSSPPPAATSTDPATAGTTLADGSTATSAASPTAPAVPSNLLPDSGLPKSLVDSYKRGNAVALLVVRDGGSDDALVHDSLGALDGVPGLSVYATRAMQIARYAWLTQGVDVTELPALVILRPRGLTDGIPTATVSYGFRDSESVLQAAKDGLYKGPSHLPYHP